MRRYGLAWLVIAAVGCLVADCNSAAQPAAAHGPQRLANCAGVPAVRPAIVVVRCVDGSMVARRLRWSGWGTAVATATGTADIYMCEFVPQDCANGDYKSFPIVLIASGSLKCPKGTLAYARIQTVIVGRDGGVWPQHVIDAIIQRPCH